MRKKTRGFTLAELLIVVAIIAVLVAVSIPIFTSQLKKARLAVDHAAIRNAYALIQAANNTETLEINGTTYTFSQLKERYYNAEDPKNNGGYDNGIFVLSSDCNTLLEAPGAPLTFPEDTFYYKETGCNSGYCDTCATIGKNIAGVHLPYLHYKDYPLYAFYSSANNKIYLGSD